MWLKLFSAEPLSVSILPQKVTGSTLLDPSKSVQFVCAVNGHPINRIVWYKNGQPLMPLINGRVRVVTSSPRKQVLTLSSLNKDDQGMYQCFGTNDWDTAHDNTQLLLGGRWDRDNNSLVNDVFVVMCPCGAITSNQRFSIYYAIYLNSYRTTNYVQNNFILNISHVFCKPEYISDTYKFSLITS